MKVIYIHFTDNKLVADRFKFTKNGNLEIPIHQIVSSLELSYKLIPHHVLQFRISQNWSKIQFTPLHLFLFLFKNINSLFTLKKLAWGKKPQVSAKLFCLCSFQSSFQLLFIQVSMELLHMWDVSENFDYRHKM